MIIKTQKSTREAINNLKDLEINAQEFAEKSYQRSLLESELHQEILSLKKKYHQKIDPLSEILVKIEFNIFNYLQNHKNTLFDKKQSLTLPYAKLGFRKSSELILPNDQDELLTRIKSLGKQYLITQSESIKKSSLQHLSDLDLELLGINKIQKETPFITPIISTK
ncbi:MAG: host-nuclease inhibitor Gam family protein [Brevinema sp.]